MLCVTRRFLENETRGEAAGKGQWMQEKMTENACFHDAKVYNAKKNNQNKSKNKTPLCPISGKHFRIPPSKIVASITK